MNCFTALKYFNYIIFSRHRHGHGLHSPFVFSLVSDVFRNKIHPDIVCTIEKERQRLLSDSRQINVNDLGTGSAKMKKSLRKVSEIARYSSVPVKYGLLLSNMAKAFGANGVLELGTSLGISTMYMAASRPEAPVITIEGCRDTSAIALENFRSAGFTNIRLINGSFDDVLPVLKKESVRPGLVYIDGNHRKSAVTGYVEYIAEMVDSNGVIIVDDIYSSAEMSEAWGGIKGYANVTLTVDIFRMGLLFFREGLTRFDYVIRY